MFYFTAYTDKYGFDPPYPIFLSPPPPPLFLLHQNAGGGRGGRQSGVGDGDEKGIPSTAFIVLHNKDATARVAVRDS